MKDIIIKGAREHNLKNIDVKIPRDKFIVITGLSGSGKSTLAFDTLYAEGQRRYVESLSSYARQFLGLMKKPDVDSIEGLSPAISIEQKTTSKNPRSTVGTITEIYDYFRLLFARVGTVYCPDHGHKIESLSPEIICDRIKDLLKIDNVTILAPVVRQKKGTYGKLLVDLHKEGYTRARVNGKLVRTDEKITLERYKKHNIDVVIDRIEISDAQRLNEAVEQALKKGKGLVIVQGSNEEDYLFSSLLACPECNIIFEELQPRMFSFNSPFGACEACHGLGVKMEFDADLIMPDKTRCIADGGIALYRNAVDGWRGQYLGAVAKHFKFDTLKPFKKLTKKQNNILMYGSDEKIKFTMNMKNGEASWTNTGKWEGLIPQSERLYRQTNSDYRRRELEKFMRISSCPSCEGKRLQKKILSVLIAGKSIIDLTELSIGKCNNFFNELKLYGKELKIAGQILKEIRERLDFLEKVGLTYLTLARAAGTLSGGEAQRIRLATQIGSNLMGVLYILDEPSIGLHQRDNQKLINTLYHLRDIGNTMIVVEHDEDTIRKADYVLDLGPGAGLNGGEIVSSGTPEEIMSNEASLTGKYLSGKLSIEIPEKRRKPIDYVTLRGCKANNLKNLTVRIPTGVFTLITGVSGSGKSTLIYETLYKALKKQLYGSNFACGKHSSLKTNDAVDKIVIIDQSPIGRTPRSNPATYTKVFDDIRNLFAQLPEAKLRGYMKSRFSFNVKGGRCEACNGNGLIKIEMNFLPDIYITCEECKGTRFNRETLEVRYKGFSIADVLMMSVNEANKLFKNIPFIRKKLDTLIRVGLDYIKLGQSSITLSGGEAQRIKITRELSKRGTGKTMYLLDEPTSGLHFHDIKKLIKVLNDLVDLGNSVIVIEHNLDVIKSADYIIDLGPDGGDGGGTVIAKGTPEQVARNKKSYTGFYLKDHLVKKKKIETQRK